jgi:Leucine-rich repeat (LRR) protein
MTNPSNLVQSQPISLVNQTVSFTITRNLQNSNMTDHVRALVNTSFTRAWLDLKYSAQNFSLGPIMSNIERSFVEDQQRSRNITFSQEQVNDVLEKNRDILFKTLAETFQAERIFGSSIPVDISSYERLQRAWEDKALKKIWNLRLARLFVFHGPAPTSPDQIKAWLKDPANAAQLNGVQTLDLSGLELRAIPPEISALTQLQYLHLSDNQISSIPNSLGNLPLLQQLDLARNQISSIPDSLSNLPQLKVLNLANNQMISIPDSFSKLSQLKSLGLINNQMISIPDSFSNLLQLRVLNLANNQISRIPDSLSNLQLQVLILKGNHISSVPDSLRKLSVNPIQRLDFNDNPLLFIYDKSPVSSNILELVAQCSEFKEYKCLSSFSNLCQFIVCNNDDHKMIKEAFGNLKKSDQNLIFEMAYKISGVHSNEDPIFWGEHHVFDDMNIFYRSVKIAIAAKFDRLSLEEKKVVYEEIYQLAQPTIEDPKWGEQHAFDNVLRLIDAMDRIQS